MSSLYATRLLYTSWLAEEGGADGAFCPISIVAEAIEANDRQLLVRCT